MDCNILAIVENYSYTFMSFKLLDSKNHVLDSNTIFNSHKDLAKVSLLYIVFFCKYF